MSDLSGGAKCLKYLLFFFNLLFFLLGFILFIIAIVVIVQTSNTETVFSLKSYLIGYLIVSIIIIAIAFLGCCGAVRENRCLLITFIIFLVLILIICLAVQIALGVGLTWMDGNADKELARSTSNYTNNKQVKDMWDFMQIKYQCCGVYNYTDWLSAINNADVPDTCCILSNTTKQQAEGCGKGLAALKLDAVKNKIYTDGCQDDFKAGLRLIVLGALVVVGILLFVEVVGIILSCCLQRSIAENESYNKM